MHLFSKKCFCGRAIPFRALEKFDEHTITRVLCADCVAAAPGNIFQVAVAGVAGWNGVYSIFWNRHYLVEKDPGFKDTAAYFRGLVEKGAVKFGFLPQRTKRKHFKVVDQGSGIREHPKKSAAAKKRR